MKYFNTTPHFKIHKDAVNPAILYSNQDVNTVCSSSYTGSLFSDCTKNMKTAELSN